MVLYTLNELIDYTFWRTGSLKFEDEVTSIRSEVTSLQSQGVNKIIALGHAGFAVDTKIATQVEGVDVVIGGHTNTFLYTGKNSRCVCVGGGGGRQNNTFLHTGKYSRLGNYNNFPLLMVPW